MADTSGNGESSRYRIFVVNGVFVSGGVGEDGRTQPHRLFTALAAHLEAATGMRARAVWAYRDRREYSPRDFFTIRGRRLERYAEYLAAAVRDDLAALPLAPGERLAWVVYSGGAAVAQTATMRLRPFASTGAYVFFGPALQPRLAPPGWADSAQVGAILGQYDWIQGVFPRLPRPWHGGLRPSTLARIRRALPARTRYRTLPCDHWPGYFRQEHFPALVEAIVALLRPADVNAGERAA